MHHKLVLNINSISLSKLRKFIAKQSINFPERLTIGPSVCLCVWVDSVLAGKDLFHVDEKKE